MGQGQGKLPPVPPICRRDPFCAFLADPFISGTEYEGGYAVHQGFHAAVETLHDIASKLADNTSDDLRELKTSGRVKQGVLHASSVLERGWNMCADLLRCLVEQDQNKFVAYMKTFHDTIVSLPINEVLVVPGGWNGANTAGGMVYIVQRISETEYSFTIISTLQGLEYHPCTPCDSDETPPKLKYHTSITLNPVSQARVSDVGWWTTALSMWTRDPPGQYQRVEVLYDVLFPWLIGDQKVDGVAALTLDKYVTKSANGTSSSKDIGSDWRTPQRSGATVRCVLEAIRYLLRLEGLDTSVCSQVIFAIKRELYVTAAADAVKTLRDVQKIPLPEVLQPAIWNYFTSILGYFGKTDIGGGPEEPQQPGQPPKPPRMPITADDIVLLQYGTRLLSHRVLKEKRLGRLPDDKAFVHARFLRCASVILDTLYSVLRPPPTILHMSSQVGLVESIECPNQYDAHHLVPKDISQYLGSITSRMQMSPPDIISLPNTVNNIQEAVAAIVCCETLVEELIKKAFDSATSARHAITCQAISLIQHLFLDVIPVPDYPISLQEAQQHPRSLWDSLGMFLTKDTQLMLMDRLVKLSLMLARLWYESDPPGRAADSERFLVSGCILVIFDCVVRCLTVGDAPLALSSLLWDDGGYAISTTVCKNNRSYASVAATLELHVPAWLGVRSRVLSYMSWMSNHRHQIFMLRQPEETFEFRRYGPTVAFLLGVMERYGYGMFHSDEAAGGGAAGQNEMELLMSWLSGDRTPLCHEHPEFAYLRDISLMFKLLATMEVRSSELTRRRNETAKYMYWRLSFDDQGRGGVGVLGGSGYAAEAVVDVVLSPPRWELMGVRGADMDIADVKVSLGDRHSEEWTVMVGEGSVVDSPADVGLILGGLAHPSEDDIIHATRLPNYDETLSREESEQLFSAMTVEYIRIPLVLSFFASQDRATYLFNTALRDLLHACVFESGTWVSQSSKMILRVPVRRTSAFLRDAMMARNIPVDAELNETLVLGCTNGLLLNELTYSPSSTLSSLTSILKSLDDMEYASVHSHEATFILYLLEFVVDVMRFIYAAKNGIRLDPASQNPLDVYGLLLEQILFNKIQPILERWSETCTSVSELPTACVLRAFLGIIWGLKLENDNLTPTTISNYLSNMCFVRNWHGFGLGFNRTDIEMKAGEEGLDARSRLLRFLQSQGIDTSRMSSEEIEQYVAETNRPLFLHVRGRTIRVPRLSRAKVSTVVSEGQDGVVNISDVPPADVPESRMFSTLDRVRHKIVNWVHALDSSVRNNMLQQVLVVALRSPEMSVLDWRTSGHAGRYISPEVDLTIDLQTLEIIWRGGNLKPVPDRMTHHAEYETWFGNEARHCGVVSESANRLWIHVIRTPYDIAEWSAPSPYDQGVGAPKTGQSSDGAPLGAYHRRQRLYDEAEQYGKLASPVDALKAVYRGREYCRALDIYSEDEHPIETEKWVVDILKKVLLPLFPPMPPTAKLQYTINFPKEQLSRRSTQARLLACDHAEFADATWKEFVVYKEPARIDVFMLQPYGRQMFRSMIFTSDTRYSIHSMPMIALSAASVPPSLQYAAGDIKIKRKCSPSLLILRRVDSDSREGAAAKYDTYIPPRLLQGTVPDAILESFHFWQDSEGTLISTPLDGSDAQWFSYSIRMHLNEQIPVGDDQIWCDSTTRMVNVRSVGVAGATKDTANSDVAYFLRRRMKGDVPTSPVEAVDEQIKLQARQLSALGFSVAACELSLRKNNGDSDAAASWLLDEENRQEIIAVEMINKPEPSTAGDVVMVDETALAMLMSQGVDQDQAEAILKETRNDVDAAMLVLAQKLESSARVSETGHDVKRAKVESSDERKWNSSDLILVQLNDLVTESDPIMTKLREVLVRLDDLSHVLCWVSMTEEGSIVNLPKERAKCRLALVELPRIKLRLEPVVVADPSGQMKIRLHLVDHVGWYVCETEWDVAQPGAASNVVHANEQLSRLLYGIKHGMLIETMSGDLMLLLPNYDVYRPRVRGAAFTASPVFDRGSMGWQKTVRSRYYLYKIHPSQSLLHSQTLAASLYLLLMRAMSRQYEHAINLTKAIHTDMSFTPEEKWMWNQLIRADDDQHPDMHALRLHLTLAVQFSDNSLPWEPHYEVDRYLASLPHVSSFAVLNVDEELDVMTYCKQGTSRLKNRLAYVRVMKSCMTKGTPTVVKDLVAPHPRVAGRPWWQLNCLSRQVVEERGVSLTRISYAQHEKLRAEPNSRGTAGVLGDEAIYSFINEDLVISDEMSGVNHNLGFVFFYQVLTGKIKLEIAGSDVSKSLGEIWLRYAHLRAERWGRAALEEGEEEIALQVPYVELAALLFAPNAVWPRLPNDGQSVGLLRAGCHVYGQEMRHSELKPFLDTLSVITKNILDDPSHTRSVIAYRADVGDFRKADLAKLREVPVAPGVARARNLIQFDTSDTTCQVRKISLNATHPVAGNLAATCGGEQVVKADLMSMLTVPLAVIDVDSFITWIPSPEKPRDDLPFVIDQHPVARAPVSVDLLARLREDVKWFASTVQQELTPRLQGCSKEELLAYVQKKDSNMLLNVINNLRRLCIVLRDLQKRDLIAAKILMDGIRRTSRLIECSGTSYEADEWLLYFDQLFAQNTTGVVIPGVLRWVDFALRACEKSLPEIDANSLCACLVSSVSDEMITSCCPSPHVWHEPLMNMALLLPLYVSRWSHSSKALAVTLELLSGLHSCLSVDYSASVNQQADRLDHTATKLADILTWKRHYTVNNNDEYSVDPRFLIFEYESQMMLRKRQVEIIGDFMKSMREGTSDVRQMIMGAGKTTVLAPLLSLMLSNAQTLILHVMPTALLEQSRTILRSCFQGLLPKRVFTLDFERGVEDDPNVISELERKLLTVRRSGGVVCSAPECVKSLFLKYIEQLHVIEESDIHALLPELGQARANRIKMRVRDKMISRSQMADAIVPVLDVFKTAIVLMDEVDVLLHPLKSELNFPLGQKFPIDMAGPRWELPMFLLDAILSHKFSSLTEVQRLVQDDENNKEIYVIDQVKNIRQYPLPRSVDIVPTALKILDDPLKLLYDIHDAIDFGYKTNALQRQPHLVLLNQTYYHTVLKPLLARWAALFLFAKFVTATEAAPRDVCEYIQLDRIDPHRWQSLASLLGRENMKLVNLARNWITSLLPHVLSKIDRVSYGLLTSAQFKAADARTPIGRLYMAIPFVGKDVPSRSSEFAHPDALIGLTVLAYRFEGLRVEDVYKVVSQLKRDFARQGGPREERPASKIFHRWTHQALDRLKNLNLSTECTVLPLSLCTPNDPAQLKEMHRLFGELPSFIHHYLYNHVFPQCLTFQPLKVSAAGHELGSSLLFGRRLGFSGTPNNLLPLDLGVCHYEPGSDGLVLHVLSSSSVVNVVAVQPGWTARSILDMLSTASVSSVGKTFHALIDTGALMTGLMNEQVANYLLRILPTHQFDGVVFLDERDRQMIVMRGRPQPMMLTQCGVSVERRFTFYDQVHTTGMDIVHSPAANAVVTIGKDMTFRDYAQGSFRMRQIGKGQNITVFVTPEVSERVKEDLGTRCTGHAHLDIIAWLLLNSMKAASLQSIKLDEQELQNVWRKVAVQYIVNEVKRNGGQPEMQRLMRFIADAESSWLSTCLGQFKDPITFTIPGAVPLHTSMTDKLRESIASRATFIEKDPSIVSLTDHVVTVMDQLVGSWTEARKLEGVNDVGWSEESLAYVGEVVHEQEQEQEQEQEEEQEMEEQKMSQYARDDEQANSWDLTCLQRSVDVDSPFYQLSDLKLYQDFKSLPFDSHMLISDNFFRPAWGGAGSRRLKNVAVLLEWFPINTQQLLTALVSVMFRRQGAQTDPGKAVQDALQIIHTRSLAGMSKTELGSLCSAAGLKECNPFVIAVSLAEAETIRRAIHTNSPGMGTCVLCLRTLYGNILDCNGFLKILYPTMNDGQVDIIGDHSLDYVTCMKFFNGEMYYAPKEIEKLKKLLSQSSFSERKEFFSTVLRLRERSKQLWEDAPVVRVLDLDLSVDDVALHQKSLMLRFGTYVRESVRKFHMDPYAILDEIRSTAEASSPSDTDESSLKYDVVTRWIEKLRLPLSPADLYTVTRALDSAGRGIVPMRAILELPDMPTPDDVAQVLRVSDARRKAKQMIEQQKKEGKWTCPTCTYSNPMTEIVCEACGCGWSGMRECPKDKWTCAIEYGGCSFFNPKSSFYCEMCNKARPDLRRVRL